MNPNRGSYSQKKKKEALRRLSHGGPRGGKGRRQANPEDSRAFVRGTRRARRSRDSLEEDGHSSSMHRGRTVFATNSPSSGTNLVIQRTVEGLSQGSDSPDLEQTSPRRIVASADNSSRSGTTSLFGKSTEGMYSGAAFSSRMFSSSQRPSDQSDSKNPFKDVSPPKNLFGKSENVKSENVFGHAASSKNPYEGQTYGVSLTGSTTSGIPETLFKTKEAVPGRESVTRNLFGKALETSDSGQSTSTKLVTTLADQTSTKVVFRREGPSSGNVSLEASTAVEAKQKLPSRKLLEKSNKASGQREATAKRQLSPSRAEATRKRTLTTFDDPFSSSSQSDITDLETFGTSKKEPKPKKPVIKRSGIFVKAIAEASGIDRDSRQYPRSRTKSRSPERRQGISPDDRKHHGPVEQKRLSPDKQTEDIGKKYRDENKPARRASTSQKYSSPEEIKKITTILVKGVPSSVNSRIILRGIFSKFGSVKRVTTNPSKNHATIAFLDHDAAADAKKRVRALKRGTDPVSIFWKQGEQGTRRGNRPLADEDPLLSGGRDKTKRDAPRQSLGPFNRKLEDGTSTVRPSTSQPAGSSQQKTTVDVPTHLLSKTVGLTAQERYDILEGRDKILRQGLKKQSNLATAKAIKGTCPDMCPEKERYMRVVQRRLHQYETLPGTTDKVNHDTAVKEYSRSSADQEEPLPHEMRPAPVLTMTMDYLMRYIVNNGRDGHWEGWFDFLWSRTRGIRKDITQQDLCNLTAIDLMEKCARFHIFCSHRLCEEDRNTVDPKINNENLTKCMQSLKQFYHDLAGEGAICPNEAEFRAYDILLNLNDRDILR